MTFEPGQLLAFALFLPFIGAAAIGLLGRAPNLREAATLITGVLEFAIVWELVGLVAAGERPAFTLLEIGPGLALAFELEPLGALFAAIASGLWIVNSLFSIGYMRGNAEHDQTRFFMLFPVAIASAIAIASAADLVTMFVFYEVLTLSTYPLVSHKGDDKARRGARIYLMILLGTSLGLLLPAIAATFAVTGELAFAAGGMFPAGVSYATAGLILVLFAFGIGKAALMPVHSWLPNAMVAPTPVSALLHAVAVVKAGVFIMLKVSIYVFGPDLMQALPAAKVLAWVAGASIVIASLVAWTKDNLKARLAYSTISQLAYVTLGAMLATPAALLGAALQILMHAFGKITLFMGAGSIYTGAKKTEISTMAGLGRAMPWTFGAFLIGALSIIGLPPLAGAWSKFYLMIGAAEGGRPWLIAALAVSSVLNVGYLLPMVVRAFFAPPPEDAPPPRGSPFLAVLAPCLTAAGCFVLFFVAPSVASFLAPIFEAGGRP
ncbi:MAG: proton-conducting transporter membrane subunit [Maricaulaceae bacterium]|jgi:multicomponent Na+:H+ antiporter subunit D